MLFKIYNFIFFLIYGWLSVDNVVVWLCIIVQGLDFFSFFKLNQDFMGEGPRFIPLCWVAYIPQECFTEIVLAPPSALWPENPVAFYEPNEGARSCPGEGRGSVRLSWEAQCWPRINSGNLGKSLLFCGVEIFSLSETHIMGLLGWLLTVSVPRTSPQRVY